MAYIPASFSLSLDIPTVDRMLTPGMSFGYLRVLTGVSFEWSIIVRYGCMSGMNCASTTWNLETKEAHVMLNPLYDFSPAALAKALTHELFEIALADLWHVTLKMQRMLPTTEHSDTLVDEMRFARDQFIDNRLGMMPFWTRWDHPLKRENYAHHI